MVCILGAGALPKAAVSDAMIRLDTIVGEGFVCTTLKGSNSIAQGNALGKTREKEK